MRIDKINNAFATIIDQALDIYKSPRVIFAEPGEDFPGCEKKQYLTIIFILKGCQNVRFYHKGELILHPLSPGEVLFLGNACPSDRDWRLPCSRLGAVVDNQHVGMSWHYLKQGITAPDICPHLWFSCLTSADSELLHLFKILSMRDGSPVDSEITFQLPRLILMKLQETVLTKEPVPLRKCFDTYQKICHYMDYNYKQPINRKTVASLFNLNTDYISRLFQEKGDIQFTDYLSNLRLEKAAELLRLTALSIQEIANQCGFTSSSYFIRVFRRKFNCSPGEYRNNR